MWFWRQKTPGAVFRFFFFSRPPGGGFPGRELSPAKLQATKLQGVKVQAAKVQPAKVLRFKLRNFSGRNFTLRKFSRRKFSALNCESICLPQGGIRSLEKSRSGPRPPHA